MTRQEPIPVGGQVDIPLYVAYARTSAIQPEGSGRAGLLGKEGSSCWAETQQRFAALGSVAQGWAEGRERRSAPLYSLVEPCLSINSHLNPFPSPGAM